MYNKSVKNSLHLSRIMLNYTGVKKDDKIISVIYGKS